MPQMFRLVIETIRISEIQNVDDPPTSYGELIFADILCILYINCMYEIHKIHLYMKYMFLYV